MPAPGPLRDPRHLGAAIVAIQLQRNSRGAMADHPDGDDQPTAPGCYFDVRVKFPSSGNVRLDWSYPTQDPDLGYFDPLAPHRSSAAGSR